MTEYNQLSSIESAETVEGLKVNPYINKFDIEWDRVIKYYDQTEEMTRQSQQLSVEKKVSPNPGVEHPRK